MRNIFSDIVSPSLSAEFTEFQLGVKARLGEHEKGSVELSEDQMWYALSEADMEFSALVAKAQAMNSMSHFYGQTTNANLLSDGFNFTYSYLDKLSEGYSDQSGFGQGAERDGLGKVTLTANVQTYYLPDTMTDVNDNAINWDRGIKIQEIYQNDYVTQMRYIDTGSYYNIMAGEFGVQSALYNTMFSMMPVNANVMMMQHTKFNNKLRLSMYTGEWQGKNQLRLTPKPSADGTMYIRYHYNPSLNANVSTTAGDGSTSTADTSVIGNFTQVNTEPLLGTSLNGIAKRWIRRYGLAICKEILSFNRGKYRSIPFASENNTIELNYEMLDSQAREEKRMLLEELTNDLEEILNPAKQLERKAQEAEYANKIKSYEPMGIGIL